MLLEDKPVILTVVSGCHQSQANGTEKKSVTADIHESRTGQTNNTVNKKHRLCNILLNLCDSTDERTTCCPSVICRNRDGQQTVHLDTVDDLSLAKTTGWKIGVAIEHRKLHRSASVLIAHWIVQWRRAV